ncbi:hypothetical protein NLX83_22520 [Allokutzneria sp. A3M-2-11 16]|uniref:hypothetical protein n=1 Tax=Allokutzneria sp. A3M-2-11 16 TaxID=2962043 RepID=UPI0020B6B46C|nr:hypothetical protein [Allokutzneria sp. A3M-2-11 16]MCP3802043.1 hypothetical protein [Allokutzneria sp. A3M-2-11 16]
MLPSRMLVTRPSRRPRAVPRASGRSARPVAPAESTSCAGPTGSTGSATCAGSTGRAVLRATGSVLRAARPTVLRATWHGTVRLATTQAATSGTARQTAVRQAPALLATVRRPAGTVARATWPSHRPDRPTTRTAARGTPVLGRTRPGCGPRPSTGTGRLRPARLRAGSRAARLLVHRVAARRRARSGRRVRPAGRVPAVRIGLPLVTGWLRRIVVVPLGTPETGALGGTLGTGPRFTPAARMTAAVAFVVHASASTTDATQYLAPARVTDRPPPAHRRRT